MAIASCFTAKTSFMLAVILQQKYCDFRFKAPFLNLITGTYIN